MVIVEGPDGAGKSTLCANLKRDSIVDEILPSPKLSKGDLGVLTWNYFREYGGNKRIAVDRMLFSELVYGPLLRQKIVFSPKQFIELMDMLLYQEYNPVVFCLPTNLNFKRDENPEVIAKSYDLHRRYQFMSDIFTNLKHFNFKPCAFRYDWEDPKSYPALLEFLR